MKSLGVLFAALCCFAVSACGTARFQDIDRSLPHAALEFHKGYTTGAEFRAGTFQAYVLTNDQGGSDPQLAATFTWSTGDQQTRYVPVGTRIYIHATTTYSTVTGVRSDVPGGYYAETSDIHCNGSAAFSPIAGRTYRVEQAELRYGVCEMRVIDLTTGQPPPDLGIVGNPAAPSVPPKPIG